jgi:hypothetical protein
MPSRMRRQASLETNLARKGLWSSGPVQLELPLDAEDLLGLVRSTGRLKVSPDLEVLAWITERWRQDRPLDRWVHFTLYELGQALYGRKPSGADCRGIRESLLRLKLVTVTLAGYDAHRGQSRPNVASLDNLLDRIVTELDDLGPEATPEQLGGLRGSTFRVQLPPWLAAQLAAGSITYLDWAVLRRLDGLAKRLWVYLQAERYKPNGRGSEATWIKLGDRAFATLGMNYAQDRQARAALKRAGQSICGADPRFESVTVEARPGGWAIVAQRTGRDMRRGEIRAAIRESFNRA